MTMAERQEIFAKEYLSIGDIQKLFDMDYGKASGYIREIKRTIEYQFRRALRLNVVGKIHIQDYLDYIGVNSDRYGMNQGEQDKCKE